MANALDERSAPPGNGSYIPELFLMAISNAREQRRSRAGMVVELLRIQDELALTCTPCRAVVPLKIFTVADAERLCGLAQRGRMEEVREEIVDRYGEYIATCPICLKRSLLPLRLPRGCLAGRPVDGDHDGAPAAGEAA